VVERYVHDAHGRTFALNSGGCRRTDIDCDGLVGATDLVLVRNAFAIPAPSGAREDLCGPGPGNDTPDGIIDDADLACVRADLGLGVSGLYNDAPPAPPTDGYPRPLRTFSLHGLTYDRATGLVFARARYYHPELGRWTRRDPKGYVDGGNLYEAFGSNPARNIDPFGMWYYPANPFVIDHSPEAAEAALIFPRAVVDTVINAPIEAASEVLREEGLEDSYTSYAYALFVELPARSIVAREANTAALEGRAIDLSLLHFAAIGGKHYGGIDAMTDGLNRFSLTSLQELTASESLAMFASGASQYAGTFAAGAGTPAAATKITQGSIKVASRAGTRLPQRVQRELQVTLFDIASREGTAASSRTAGALAIEAGRLTLPSAGAEGSTVLRFAVLNREFVPDARTVLQNLTNSQNARLAGNLRLAEFYLTEEELISSGLSIGHARMNYGKIVERMVASEVQSDALLRGLFSPAGVGRTGPDFLGQGPANGQLLDITTANPMTIRKHLARPYGEDLTVITYERPAGFP
jgi:RHS repeat-associated protein